MKYALLVLLMYPFVFCCAESLENRNTLNCIQNDQDMKNNIQRSSNNGNVIIKVKVSNNKNTSVCIPLVSKESEMNDIKMILDFYHLEEDMDQGLKNNKCESCKNNFRQVFN